MLKSLQRDFAVVLVMLAGALVLLGLLLRDLGGGLPSSPASTGGVGRLEVVVPMGLGERLFSAEAVISPVASTEAEDSFYTLHFQPAPQPAPQAPTTRKVKLTYLGYLQAGDGPRSAVVLAGDSRWTGGAGSNLVANLFVGVVEADQLVVTNADGASHALPFRRETTLEVPLP